MPRLIFGDVHDKMERLNKILTKYGHIKQKTCVGDWFDSFEDPMGVKVWDTIRAFRDFLEDPDHETALGNHDMSYRFNKVEAISCSGWTKGKEDAIRGCVTECEWDLTKLFFWYEINGKNWVISHAGIHPSFAAHPITGIDKTRMEVLAEEAMYKLKFERTPTPLVMIGKDRGFRRGPKVGGITWMDLSSFEPIEGINQIVGHTAHYAPCYLPGTNSENWCIDTFLKHVAILDDDGKCYIEMV